MAKPIKIQSKIENSQKDWKIIIFVILGQNLILGLRV